MATSVLLGRYPPAAAPRRPAPREDRRLVRPPIGERRAWPHPRGSDGLPLTDHPASGLTARLSTTWPSPGGYNGQDHPPCAIYMAVWSCRSCRDQVSAAP